MFPHRRTICNTIRDTVDSCITDRSIRSSPMPHFSSTPLCWQSPLRLEVHPLADWRQSAGGWTSREYNFNRYTPQDIRPFFQSKFCVAASVPVPEGTSPFDGGYLAHPVRMPYLSYRRAVSYYVQLMSRNARSQCAEFVWSPHRFILTLLWKKDSGGIVHNWSNITCWRETRMGLSVSGPDTHIRRIHDYIREHCKKVKEKGGAFQIAYLLLAGLFFNRSNFTTYTQHVFLTSFSSGN